MGCHFQRRLRLHCIESRPSFVRAPRENGFAWRLVRTLKEQLVWIGRFGTAGEPPPDDAGVQGALQPALAATTPRLAAAR